MFRRSPLIALIAISMVVSSAVTAYAARITIPLASTEPDKNWLSQAVYPVTLDPTVEINILNVHSHPRQGDNWEVS